MNKIEYNLSTGIASIVEFTQEEETERLKEIANDKIVSDNLAADLKIRQYKDDAIALIILALVGTQQEQTKALQDLTLLKTNLDAEKVKKSK